MMKLKHKIFILFFIITFLIFLYLYCKYSLGFFFDMPTMFSTMIYQFEDYDIWFYNMNIVRVRNFSDVIGLIPFNLFYHVCKHSLICLFNLFSISWYIGEIGVILFNFLIARITKRYDIAIISFCFYCIFIMPNLIWALRGDLHIALLIYFAVLSFFLAKEKLKKIHLLLIIPLIIYLFESFETTIFFGIILFIAALIYSKKENNINKNYQMIMGIGSFVASLYIPLRLLYFVLNNNVDLYDNLCKYMGAIDCSIKSLCSSNLIIFLFGFIVLVFLIFYKKDFDKKSLLFFIPYFSIMLILLYLKTGFIPNALFEVGYWTIAFICIFPLIILILLMDYKNLDIKIWNKNFYPNLIILSCIIGIFNMLWCLLYCPVQKNLLEYLGNLKKSSNEVIIELPKEVYDKYNNFIYSSTVLNYSIFFADNYEIKNIIMPEFGIDKYNTTIYNNDLLLLLGTNVPEPSKFYDISKIKEEFVKQNRVYVIPAKDIEEISLNNLQKILLFIYNLFNKCFKHRKE